MTRRSVHDPTTDSHWGYRRTILFHFTFHIDQDDYFCRGTSGGEIFAWRPRTLSHFEDLLSCTKASKFIWFVPQILSRFPHLQRIRRSGNTISMEASRGPPRVKNKAPAPQQISAEQLLREAVDRQEPGLQAPTQRFADLEELHEFQGRKRKEFEDYVRRNRINMNNWMRYVPACVM